MEYAKPHLELIKVREQEIFLEESVGVGVGGNGGGPDDFALLTGEPFL